MFDMQYSGKAIAKARKAKNMTQMELADALNISYQAVSNWARGVSMPDISKLPELAEILEISTDEMLGKNSKVIDDVLNNGNFEEVTVEEVVEAAPLLRPEQVDKVVETMEDKLKLKEIQPLLPFLSEDFIDEIFQRLVAAGDTDSMQFVAAFASEDVIDEYFKTGNAPVSLSPFVSEDVLDEVAWKKYREEGVRAITGYCPFMSEDSLQKIAEEEYQKNSDLNAILPLAPFLSEDYLGTLAVKAVEKDGIKAIVPIAPFINTDVLEKYIREKYL